MIFCPKFSESHIILFWINLGFLAIGLIGASYTKKLFFAYKNKQSKILEILTMMIKALNIKD